MTPSKFSRFAELITPSFGCHSMSRGPAGAFWRTKSNTSCESATSALPSALPTRPCDPVITIFIWLDPPLVLTLLLLASSISLSQLRPKTTKTVVFCRRVCRIRRRPNRFLRRQNKERRSVRRSPPENQLRSTPNLASPSAPCSGFARHDDAHLDRMAQRSNPIRRIATDHQYLRRKETTSIRR